jgi:hypothetical protein
MGHRFAILMPMLVPSSLRLPAPVKLGVRKMKEKLYYSVSRGKRAGTSLEPHRYEDGYFQAHKTNSRNDPDGKRVKTEAELVQLVRLGYHVRMSNIEAGHAPSTVKPEIICV